MSALYVKNERPTMSDMAEKKPCRFTFRTSQDVIDELERIANEEDRTPSWLVDRAIRDWLGRRRGSYETPASSILTTEAASIAQMWSKLAPAQRKLVADLLKSGLMEARGDLPPEYAVNEIPDPPESTLLSIFRTLSAEQKTRAMFQVEQMLQGQDAGQTSLSRPPPRTPPIPDRD